MCPMEYGCTRLCLCSLFPYRLHNHVTGSEKRDHFMQELTPFTSVYFELLTRVWKSLNCVYICMLHFLLSHN